LYANTPMDPARRTAAGGAPVVINGLPRQTALA